MNGTGKPAAWIKAHVAYAGDDCIQWPFCTLRGRGMLRYEGKKWYAHRIMCILAKGEPPTPEHEAAHECGNGHLGCVNPNHLNWKTRTENRRDSIRHGTSVRSRPRLSRPQVAQIRTLKGKESAYVVAERYEVSPTAIYLIWQGRTFKHTDYALA